MPFVHELFSFINEYGYLAVFIGSLFEGESILLIAGLLAQQDHLSLPFILVYAFLGAVVGDLAWFLAGRHGGNRLTKRFPLLLRWSAKPTILIKKYPRLISTLMRFMYGFRSVVPFSIGLSGIRLRTFLPWNMLGALLWVGVFGGVGYLLGEAFEALVGNVRRMELVLIMGAILAFAALKGISALFTKTVSTAIEKDTPDAV